MKFYLCVIMGVVCALISIVSLFGTAFAVTATLLGLFQVFIPVGISVDITASFEGAIFFGCLFVVSTVIFKFVTQEKFNA